MITFSKLNTSISKKIIFIIPFILFLPACKSETILNVTPESTIQLANQIEPTRTLPPPIINTGLAYGTPCKPPCWQTLVPGQSTRSEASQVFTQLRDERVVHQIIDGPAQFTVFPVEGVRAVMIGDFRDDIFHTLFGGIEFDYRIDSLVEQFNEPEGFYSTSEGQAVCSSCQHWQAPNEPTDSEVGLLLYPNKGLLFFVQVPLRGSGCICPEMKVAAYCYHKPVTMAEALNGYYATELCGLETLEDITETNMTKWHGFGGGY